MEYRVAEEPKKIGQKLMEEHHPHLLGVRVEFDEAEEWREIPGYEGLYEVSSLGRVRRSGKVSRVGRGRSSGGRIGRVLKPQSHGSGYWMVSLADRDGVAKSCLVHRLVASAFLGPCPEGQEVNHRDADKRNNRPCNLEYVTHADNNRHARRLGLVSMGRGQAKLTVDQVREILDGDASEPARVVAERYGVSKSTIVHLRSGRSKYYHQLLRQHEAGQAKEAVHGI